ncbi:MAG: ABC transporter ATP-binding protein [Gammaproteobacteria bacterium]|nr:ABC transporter ATP-binding protein [Gammaproteobacteria bacterium]
MEPSLYRYILNHSRSDQIGLIILSLTTLPLIYITLELPKKIINMLEGKEIPKAVMGWQTEPTTYLFFLSFAFLAAVLVNGGLKYILNVYRGAMGERLLRRFRYELYKRILLFPIPHFKRVSQSELIPMITAETEPLAEFIGESFTLPVFQGGILFTYLFFIFEQDVLLGLAAISLYPFQLYVIPKLQKKVNQLAKERVATVRSLSGRIGETVSGINEVHTNDTSQFERAQISHRLGIIYQIRFAIYRRKFFVKFLNNFIAQLTPFFFYSVGGYFVLRGDLSIGSMVAVLVAYKDLAGPWKELLRYYQRKEDIKVKYTQIIEQFNPPNLIKPALIDSDSDLTGLPDGELNASNISYSEDGLYFSVEGASFRLGLRQHTAAVGLSNSGKDELACMLSRLINPSNGTLSIGSTNMANLPEVITGRRIGYAGQNSYLFNGTVRDNLLYPLKNRPIANPQQKESEDRIKQRSLALDAGNSEHSIEDSWIDYLALGLSDESGINQRLHETLGLVELDDEIYQYGLLSQVEERHNSDLTQRIMQAREQLHDRLTRPKYARLVEQFDHDKYNSNLSVSENLLFGTIYRDNLDVDQLGETDYVRNILDEVELTTDLLTAGKQVAEIMLDLFSDVEPDSELFKQFSFIKADDLPEFQQLLVRIRDVSLMQISGDDKTRLLSQSFKLTVARHRLGLIDEAIQHKILEARKRIREESAKHDLGIEFFDESVYNQRISIQDNILFGKLAYGQANAQEKIYRLIADIIEDLKLRPDIINAGLEYQVGVAGKRLSPSQRQKLGLARCLIKQPELLVINDATTGLDAMSERRIIERILAFMESRGVFWVLGRPQLAEQFEQVMVMERGKLTDNGKYNEISQTSKPLQQLLESD